MTRRLRVSFAEASVFREEYERNIVKGGAVIETTEAFEPRDLVEVELELGFCGESVVLEAEIVQPLGPEMTGSEGAAGVAVQFLESASVLRDTLQRYLGEGGPGEADAAAFAGRSPAGDDDGSGMDLEEMFEETRAPEVDEAAFFDHSEVDFSEGGEKEAPGEPAEERRKAPRVSTRVPARVDARSISLEGRTRNVSEAGVLISADASDLPVGTDVKLELAHPVSGERLGVEGKVSRHIETDGTVAAVGIEFGEETRGEDVGRFVEEVKEAERTLKRTGIYGAIQELGMAALVRMLGVTAERGTLTVISGDEEGSISFENGLLRSARLGELRGVKALCRFLSWEQGSFEFHARVDPTEGDSTSISVDDAIQQAVRQREDLIRADLGGMLDPAASFSIDAEALSGESGLSKTQEAVLDLVAAHFTVRRILDVIPQSDAEVIEALKSLLDGEVIRPA
jgi:Tfp pilus assembly protein PilZ